MPAGDDGLASCWHCGHKDRMRPGPASKAYDIPDRGDLWRQRGVQHWHLLSERIQRRSDDRGELDGRWVKLLDQHGENVDSPQAVLDWALPQLRNAYAQRTGVRATCYPMYLEEWEANRNNRYGSLTAGEPLYLTVHLEPGLEYHIIARPTPCRS